jgi:hypothetical protein
MALADQEALQKAYTYLCLPMPEFISTFAKERAAPESKVLNW